MIPSIFDTILVGVIIILLFRGPLWRTAQKLARGYDWRDELQAQIHDLHEVSLGESKLLADIRDTLHTQALSAAHDMKPLIGNLISALQDIADAKVKSVIDGEKVTALLGQIRDQGEKANEYYDRLSVVLATTMDLKTTLESIDKQPKEHRSRVEDHLSGIRQSLATIAEIQPRVFAQLEKSDQHVFEFVASTKRIMKAMEGTNDGSDDEQILEEARMIKARAQDRGVELTLEDSIKRARELHAYRQ